MSVSRETILKKQPFTMIESSSEGSSGRLIIKTLT